MSIFLGATINDEHTLRDWKAAITNADVISVPEANTVILEVPGRNGNLDLSEALTGDVTYRNREIKLELANGVRNNPKISSAICAKKITKRLSDLKVSPSPPSPYLVANAPITAIGINSTHAQKRNARKKVEKLVTFSFASHSAAKVVLPVHRQMMVEIKL